MVDLTKVAATAFVATAGVEAFAPQKANPRHAAGSNGPGQGTSTQIPARQNSVGWGADPALQRLGAATTGPVDPSLLTKGESDKLTQASPQSIFGHTQESVFSGKTGSSSSFNAALQSSADKNGLAFISTADWDAGKHFETLREFGGSDYASKVASTPQDRFTGQSDSVSEMYDDGKPSITEAVMTHVFEGAGKEFQSNVVVLDGKGSPLNNEEFSTLYETAATLVKSSGPEGLSPAAKVAIEHLQTYVDEGESADKPKVIKEALVEKSVLFEGWSKMKAPGYQNNLDQAMVSMSHHFDKVKPGEALVGILECPKAYGNTAHMLAVVLEKTEDGDKPKVHIAHHESADQYKGKSPEFAEGKMMRIAGVPLDTDDSRAFYGDDVMPKSRNRLPVVNSLKFGGTPNMNFLVSKNPDAIVARLEEETALSDSGALRPYSPRDTDGEKGSANTCISYTARLLAHEDSELHTTDGDPVDVSGVTSRSSPELLAEMGNAGMIAAGPIVFSDFIMTDAGIYNNKEDASDAVKAAAEKALEGEAGLTQFSALGASWGAGIFKPGMDEPASEPLPHHIGTFIGRETLKDLN